MKRRAFIAAALGGLAGCAGSSPADSPATETPAPIPSQTPTPTRTTRADEVDAPSLAELGTPPTVCAGGIVDLGIYAIEEPTFGSDWSSVDIQEQYAEDGTLGDKVVIGIENEDVARAYPLPILWHHEIVNDTVPPSDDPLLVTFCSLCRSGMVAERLVSGEPSIFGVSGQLWQPPELQARVSEDQERVFAVEPDDPDPEAIRNTGNLVMFDVSTASYWSQLLAQAICGPREGDSLTIVPSATARWPEWKDDHPNTEVLLPPPHSKLQQLPG